jgi:glycine cleavage system regulatory protein
MTVIGPDRPGLVESIANAVAAHEGNWLESRMSRLGGQFAGILRVEVPAENEPALVGALRSLESKQLTVVLHRDAAPVSTPSQPLSVLEIVGHDRPGIVREISRVLAANGVNVEELSSELGSAAMSGEMLFKAKARLRIPSACDVPALRAALERLAGDLIVDISLET